MHRFGFYVNGTRYTHDVHTISGAQVRAMVPRIEVWDQLWVEGTGDVPDWQLGHNTAVSIEAGTTRLYSVPPSMGG